MKQKTINTKIHYFNELGGKWDEIVGNNSDRLKQIENVFAMISMHSGDRVLDAGCGNGVLFKFIENLIGEKGQITAVDAADNMIRRAKELYPQYNNIRYCVGMLEDVELESEYFNVILCFSIIPHVDNLPGVLSNFRRSIAGNGRLYIFHLSDTLTLNKFHSGLNAPVRHDTLPGKQEMTEILSGSGFYVTTYIDRPGLNFIECAP